MNVLKKVKETNAINEEADLTEEDIQAILEAEEDIREGRVYTLEELITNLKKECGFEGKYLDKLIKE